MWPKAIICLVAILGVGDTGAWWFATNAIIKGFRPFEAAAATQGCRLTLGAPHRFGWPIFAGVRVEATAVAVGTFHLTSKDIQFEIDPWDVGTLRIVAGDPLEGTAGGQALRVSGGPIIVKAPLSTIPATFEANDLLVDVSGVYRLQHLTGLIAPLGLTFTAENVQLPEALPPPFGTGLLVSARVVTNQPFTPAETPQAAVRAWQTAGGKLGVPNIEVYWGPLHIAGSATASVDRDLQPEGQARLEVQGADSAVDLLANARVLPPGPASAVRAVIQLLSLAAHGGPVPLTITLSDGVVTAAGFPLTKIGAINWNLAVER